MKINNINFMNKQTKSGQKKYDSAVLKTAQWYENNGYKVIN